MMDHLRYQLGTRILGVLTGLGFLAFGLFAMFGGGDQVPEVNRDMTFGYGVTTVIIGVLAVLASLLAKDLTNIWCRSPRRWRK